jgi:iron transport multicopper oxidase
MSCIFIKFILEHPSHNRPPTLEATLNDTIVITVNNQLDTYTALHSHGMFQNNTGYMDGPVGVTQW